MAGKLFLTFISQPLIGQTMMVNTKYLNNTGDYSAVSFAIRFVSRRLNSGQSSLGTTLQETAQNFVTAFNLDYRNTGGDNNLYAQIVGGAIDPESGVGDTQPQVTITLKNSNWLFESVTRDTDYIEYSIQTTSVREIKKITFDGYDYVVSTCASPVGIFWITGGEIPQEGGPELYNAYVDGVKVLTLQPNPLKIPFDRSSNSVYNISFTDSLDVSVGRTTLTVPKRVSSDKIKIDVFYTENGAAITTTVDFISSAILPLTYSLDGENFIENNVFTGQPNGDYTIYVKDAFGCVTSKNITVDGVSTATEVNCEISDINPIRYSILEDGKKNRYNTLSHEQLKNVPYPFIQYFTVSDNPITQVRTNAKYLNIFALDCGGNKSQLTPVKRSNHIGQQLRTTAVKFSTEDGKLGIFFGVVDVLDNVSGEVLESKDFGYQVPQAFNKVGRLVTIEGLGTIPIKDISYNEEYEAFVLIFESAYTGEEITTSLSATYNIQNYEVYEFVTPISQMPESFNVVIEAGLSLEDIRFTFISERIERTVDSDDFVEMIYWNSENFGAMNYATGVVHTLRLHTVLSRLSDSQSVSGYNGDVERYVTDNEIFDGEEFIFGYLSEEMARKIRMVLAHDMLFINGVHYRLGDESPELTSRFSTNICELTAVLHKGGDVTESFDASVIQPATGEGVDQSTYELEQAISAARGKALILWKR